MPIGTCRRHLRDRDFNGGKGIARFSPHQRQSCAALARHRDQLPGSARAHPLDDRSMKPSFPAREVLWFLFWLVALSGPVSAFIVHLGTQPPMMSRMLMWCPGAAALLTCLICRINVKSLGWNWPSSRFMAWGYFLPWLYAIPVYVIVWLLIPGSFEWGQYSAPLADQFKITAHPTAFAALFGIPTTMTLIVVGTFAWALGEEIGWRGSFTSGLAWSAPAWQVDCCGRSGTTRACSAPTTTPARQHFTQYRASRSWSWPCRS
jgi:hypothetical protein